MALSGNNALFRTGNSENFFSNLAVAGNGVSAATPNNIYVDTAGGGESTFLQVQSKNDVRKASFMLFDLDGGSNGSGLTVPKGSLITDAYLRVRSQNAWTGTMNDLSAVVVARDGVWDTDVTFGLQGISGAAPCVVRDTGAGVRANTGATASFAWEANQSLLDSRTQLGQVVTIVGAGTLGSCDFTLSRMLTSSGSVSVRVYAVSGAGRITGGVLATSDTVPYNNLSLTTGAVQTFNFSGANQIALSDATKYAFIVSVTGSLRFRVHAQAPAAYATGGSGAIIAGGVVAQFSECAYPQHGNLPLLYEADDSTIRTAPHGGISPIPSIPDFALDNTFYEIRPTRLKDRIQEWIDDPAYVEGGGPTASWVPIHIAPTAATAIGNTRQWDLSELRLSWRPRETFVG